MAAFLAGCASLNALPPAMEVADGAAPGFELRAVEGQPSGLLLAVAASTEGVDVVELYRLADGGEPVLLHTFDSDENSGALEAGVELLDNEVLRGGAFTYQLLGVTGDTVVARSEALYVEWNPPRPVENLTAEAHVSSAVQIEWKTEGECGAVIFRRDVLGEGPFQRHAAVASPSTNWVDRDVRPGGVWSYRVAPFVEVDGVRFFGEASEEVYASPPEEL